MQEDLLKLQMKHSFSTNSNNLSLALSGVSGFVDVIRMRSSSSKQKPRSAAPCDGGKRQVGRSAFSCAVNAAAALPADPPKWPFELMMPHVRHAHNPPVALQSTCDSPTHQKPDAPDGVTHQQDPPQFRGQRPSTEPIGSSSHRPQLS